MLEERAISFSSKALIAAPKPVLYPRKICLNEFYRLRMCRWVVFHEGFESVYGDIRSTFLPSSTSNVRSWDISTSDCAVLSHCALRTSWICGIGQRLLIICLYVLGKQCDNAREHIHALIDRSRTAYAITDHQTMIIPSQPHTPQLAVVSPSLSLRLSLLPLPLLKPPPAALPESLPRPGIG